MKHDPVPQRRCLGKLTEATERIGRGEFGPEIDVHGKDETGILVRAFDQMSQEHSSNTAALEKVQSDLKTLNEELVQRVVELEIEVTERRRAEETLRDNEEKLEVKVAEFKVAKYFNEKQGATLAAMAENLDAARRAAEVANRAKSEFLAAMSHELRTPLNAIIGFSEIIKNETFGPVGNAKYREYTSDIHASGHHLLGLINDILDLSKIESGKDELYEDKIEIPEIVRSALKMVGHRAEQGGVKLELELADQLPALRADERKLKQILVNLLSNAARR